MRRELAGEGVEQTTQRDMAHKSGVACCNRRRFVDMHIYIHIYIYVDLCMNNIEGV